MALQVRKSKVRSPPPGCPLTECMKLLGGAWTPNLIWYLSAGARRFGELRADIPRISAKVLSARLRALEGKGVVHRRVMPTSPPSVEYSLSELGEELIPVIHAIVAVGTKLRTRGADRDEDHRKRNPYRTDAGGPSTSASVAEAAGNGKPVQ